MSNGPIKGGSGVLQWGDMMPNADVWMVHRNMAPNAVNAPESFIVNLSGEAPHGQIRTIEQIVAGEPEDDAMYLKLSARKDGSFEIFNPRTGQTKQYPAR